MPTGPNGEKWPASPVACAVTGEKRGVVPPKRMPDQQQSEQARKAARARWNK